MICPRCQYNNREKAKFCKECGQSLILIEEPGYTPEPGPAPEPVPTPELVPAPEPVPVPEPVPTPKPVPAPKPTPVTPTAGSVSDKLDAIAGLLNNVMDIQKDISANMSKESDLDSLRAENSQLKQEISDQVELLKQKDQMLKERDQLLKEKDRLLEEKDQKIEELNSKIPKEYVCPTCFKVYSSPVKFCSECGTPM